MRNLLFLTIALISIALAASQEQQRVLRRVIKSTPTANSLGRIRQVTVRSVPAESGAVTELSSKEAAKFGQRAGNETVPAPAGTKTKQATSSTTTSTTSTQAPTTAAPSTTTNAPAPSSTSPAAVAANTVKTEQSKHKASDRQQAAPEVELLASAPSSWQSMTAVEAPVAMLIATGARSSDLASSSSNLYEESHSGDVLRSSATKGNYVQQSQQQGESFSSLRQTLKQQKQQQQQQSFFYPQPAPLRSGKTSHQATKTHWYSQPTTTSTTPRPAPIIQQEQQYEQQNEQYVEQQQQQLEYPSAPLGQAEPFAFDFNTKDSRGNGQYRKEESDKNGVVRGSYGYTDANGIYRHVEYVADQNGFRANIKSNEPGLIGETQPASIQLASGGASPSRQSAAAANNNENNESEYSSVGSENNGGSSSSNLALAPPDFESSHKSDRIRAPRNYRN